MCHGSSISALETKLVNLALKDFANCRLEVVVVVQDLATPFVHIIA